jgi:hypothetical protein
MVKSVRRASIWPPSNEYAGTMAHELQALWTVHVSADCGTFLRLSLKKAFMIEVVI